VSGCIIHRRYTRVSWNALVVVVVDFVVVVVVGVGVIVE